MANQPPAVELTLDNLDGGALAEQIQVELRKIGNSIADPNLKTTTKRKLTIGIEFAPDEQGRAVQITYSVKSSIPSVEARKCVAFVQMHPTSKDITFYEPPRLPFEEPTPLPGVSAFERQARA